MAKLVREPEAGPPRDLGELLERADEISALREYLREVAAGSGRLVAISGEAGVGKTALLRRFWIGASREAGINVAASGSTCTAASNGVWPRTSCWYGRKTNVNP